VFPFRGSVIRHPSSLHWLPWATVRQLPRYYRGAPTSCRPSRVVSFPHSAVPRTAALRQAAGSCCWPAPHRYCAGASILCLRALSWKRQDLPGSSATPLPNMLCSSTPADRVRQATCDALDVAFRALHDVGSASRPLSRLHHTACSLAVYASQLGLLRSTPRKTRFPLTATPGGTGLSPVGLLQEVSTLRFNSHRFLLLQAFPGARSAGPTNGRESAAAKSWAAPRSANWFHAFLPNDGDRRAKGTSEFAGAFHILCV